MTRSRRIPEHVVLITIVLLAAALRVYRLEAQSLWNDEGTSVALAVRDLATITRNASQDIHPPFYYYLLHAWIAIWGQGVGAVRSLSVIASLGTVIAAYALGKHFFSPSTALLAALFTAVSPFQVYYAQETRMYALATLLVLLSTLAWVSLICRWTSSRPPGRTWLVAAAYVLVSVLSVYTHYFAFAVILAQNIAFLAWLIAIYRPERPGLPGRWRVIARWALLQILILASYVPWLILSWQSLTNWPAVTGRLTIPALTRSALETLALGVTYTDGPLARWLSVGAALPCAVCLIWAAWPQRRTRSARRPRMGTWLALLYVAAPVILIYVLSLRRPMYKPKFLLLAAPAYAVLQARGVAILTQGLATTTRRRWAADIVGAATALGLLTVSASSLHALYTDPQYFRDDYQAIVAYIEATAGPEDAILINAPGQIETVDYYYDGPLPVVPLPMQRPIDTAVTERDLQGLTANRSRIYGIFWATDESDPDRFIETWLDQHTYKTLDGWYGNVRLVVYSVPTAVPDAPETNTFFRLGDTIRLTGYTVTPSAVPSGEIVQLTLFWTCDGTIDERLKTFVHLLDERGNIIAQRDSEPAGGSRPTTSWQPGDSIVDPYGLFVLPGTPPGEYAIRVGLYDAATGARLPVTSGDEIDATAGGDMIDLARITVETPDVHAPIGALGIANPHDVNWHGLALLGHSVNRLGFDHAPETPIRAGDALKLVFFWQWQGQETPGGTYTLSLRQGRHGIMWEQNITLTGGTYPPSRWSAGEILRDVHQVSLPSTLAPGEYDLMLAPAEDAHADYRLQRLTLVP